MDPATWRKEAGLSLRELAKRIGCSSASTVRRWERGEREVPNSIALAYERESKDEDGEPRVTADDLNRVRKRFLRREDGQTKAA